MTPKVWFVTGASSGLGLAVVIHALSKGDNVVATLRKPEALSSLSSEYSKSQLLIVKLDVSNPEEIISAFAAAKEKFGRIDVVYNNAGYGFLAEVEASPNDVARDMFEVNFWGAANVSREAVRFFRDVNKPSGGRLIQASSGAGIAGTPTCGYYCASKFALEGLSEALTKEVDPSWNIKITVLVIGGFRTRAVEPGALTVIPAHPRYSKTTSAIRTLISEGHVNFGDSNKAAREIHRIADDYNAPLHIALGLDALEIMKGKLNVLKEDVENSAIWCADLK